MDLPLTSNKRLAILLLIISAECTYNIAHAVAQTVKDKEGVFQIDIPKKFNSILLKSNIDIKSRGYILEQYDISLTIRGKNIEVLYAYRSSDDGLRIGGVRDCNNQGRSPCMILVYDMVTERLVDTRP
jgi:hypothetical protein